MIKTNTSGDHCLIDMFMHRSPFESVHASHRRTQRSLPPRNDHRAGLITSVFSPLGTIQAAQRSIDRSGGRQVVQKGEEVAQKTGQFLNRTLIQPKVEEWQSDKTVGEKATSIVKWTGDLAFMAFGKGFSPPTMLANQVWDTSLNTINSAEKGEPNIIIRGTEAAYKYTASAVMNSIHKLT